MVLAGQQTARSRSRQILNRYSDLMIAQTQPNRLAAAPLGVGMALLCSGSWTWLDQLQLRPPLSPAQHRQQPWQRQPQPQRKRMAAIARTPMPL